MSRLLISTASRRCHWECARWAPDPPASDAPTKRRAERAELRCVAGPSIACSPSDCVWMTVRRRDAIANGKSCACGATHAACTPASALVNTDISVGQHRHQRWSTPGSTSPLQTSTHERGSRRRCSRSAAAGVCTYYDRVQGSRGSCCCASDLGSSLTAPRNRLYDQSESPDGPPNVHPNNRLCDHHHHHSTTYE